MKKLTNFAIIICSLLVGFLLIDIFFFKSLISLLPLNRIVYLERPMRVLASSSKDNLIPKTPYMAIVGDSYAKGNGDWFLEVDKSELPPPPYQAAHLLHEIFNVDVLPIGRAGGDFLRTYTSDLPNQIDYINSMWLYSMPEPDMILFYYYAGNDFEDIIHRMGRNAYGSYDKYKLYDEKYFQGWIDKFSENDRTYFPLVNFTSVAYIGKVTADYLDKAKDSVVANFGDTTAVPDKVDWSKVNVVEFNGHPTQVGKPMQNFSLGLTDEEFKFGFYMLDQSLAYVCKKYPHAKKALVYIPSMMDCYTFVSPLVMSEKTVTAAECRENELYMEKEVGNIAEKHGLLYIDTSPGLRKEAKKGFLHGPIDFAHLNKKGYHVFADIIAHKLLQAGWFTKMNKVSYLDENK